MAPHPLFSPVIATGVRPSASSAAAIVAWFAAHADR